MPRVSLLKLVEKALLPLTLVVSAKLGSVFILSLFANSYLVAGEQNWVSTLSDLIAGVACAIGFTWVIFRAQHFTLENIHPRSASKLFQKGHHFLVTTTAEVVSEGLVWLVLGLAVLLLTLFNWSAGLTTSPVLGFVLVVGFGLGYGLIVEIRRLET